jgi:hypothetical protein
MLAADALTIALTTAITGAILVALARVAMRASPERVENGELLLVYPRPMRIGASICALLLGGTAIGLPVAAALQDDASLWRLTLIGTPILGALAVLALLEPRTQLRCGEDGIGGRTAFRGERHVRWVDVIEVTWSNPGHWLRLVDREGKVLRLSGWLAGFPHAVQHMCTQVPPVIWKAAIGKCRDRLQQNGLKLELPDHAPKRQVGTKVARRS